MKFKKLLAAICAAGLLMTGCGSDGGTNDKDPNSQETIFKVGMIAHLNASEKQMEEYFFRLQEKTHAKVVNHVPVYFDNLSTMEMAAESGNVDYVSTYVNVANYIIANNDKYELAETDWINGLSDNFCFAFRNEDAALKDDFNKALDEMQADGSLDKLVKDYILNVDKTNQPKVELPTIDGAETIKVGVTGDLPPLDLILPDNSPAGFNTALLAEVAKRLNKNIEVIQIDSGARAAALNSDQIDVIFWAIVPAGNDMPADIDKPEGVELSKPYFQDNVTHLQLKK